MCLGVKCYVSVSRLHVLCVMSSYVMKHMSCVMGVGGWVVYRPPPRQMFNCVCVPAWPDNKEKCTELFDYCVTYTEQDPNPDKPFVTKVMRENKSLQTGKSSRLDSNLSRDHPQQYGDSSNFLINIINIVNNRKSTGQAD